MARPNISQFNSPNMRRLAFLSLISFVNQRMLRLYDCELFDQALPDKLWTSFFRLPDLINAGYKYELNLSLMELLCPLQLTDPKLNESLY